MLCRFALTVLIMLDTQTPTGELTKRQASENTQDSVGMAIDRVASKLVQRPYDQWILHNVDLENVTLRKPGHLKSLQVQAQPSARVMPCFTASGRMRQKALVSLVRPLDVALGQAPTVVARQVAQALSSNSVVLPALPKTWSNRDGKVLTEVVPGAVWAAERPFLWNSIDVGGKMAVVKLSDGSLWVHSPVELEADLRTALDAIGPVAHIISPNYEHVKYAKQWKDAYPSAILYGCPGLIEKEKGIPYDVEVGQGNKAPPAWGSDIELSWFDCEKNPFLGGAFFNEVVFLHVPSGTLIVTDLYWNYPGEDVPQGTWLWKQGMDRVYLPFYKSFMIDSPSKFDAAMARVKAWEFDRVLPCHGDVITSGGKRALQDHFQGRSS